MTKRIAVGMAAVLALAVGSAAASTVVGLSIEDQARLSEFVVVGEVVAQKGVDHPGHGLETAVTFRVTEVLKGASRAGSALVFHTRGGQVGDEISEALGEAIFRTGQRALVFVERVDGRLYNLGLSMGVWDIQEDGRGGRFAVRALQDGLTVIGQEAVEHGPLSVEEMAARVGYASRNPRFDNEHLRAARGQGR